MKRAKRTIVIIGLALASCSGPVYVPTNTPTVLSVRVLATTTTYPLLQDLAAGYKRPDVLLAVQTAALNWEAVYTQLVTGQYPFALTTFVPANTRLWAAPLGHDGIAIIVNTANSVPALTVEQLRLIFQGRVTRWIDIGGPDLPITVISREPGADIRLAFDALVMQGRPVLLASQLALSSQSVINLVSRAPGAVGYVSLSRLEPHIRAVPLVAGPDDQPVTIAVETVRDGTYPLRSPLFVAGAAPPAEDSPYRDWFAWMQHGEGQTIIERWQRGLLDPATAAPTRQSIGENPGVSG
jgi:phosphate transport system substrate-binding protein